MASVAPCSRVVYSYLSSYFDLFVTSIVVFGDNPHLALSNSIRSICNYASVLECPFICKRMAKSAISAPNTAMLEPRTSHPAVTKGAAQTRVVLVGGVQLSFT